jgi:N-acylneuraminate cytidylyltransferase
LPAVALIPARGGSERVPGKNVAVLGGHPLIAYSIAAARSSGVFDAVVVSTDSEEIADAALRYGAEVPGLRPREIASSTSPDIEWVLHTMELIGGHYDVFSILRPTSPFRGPAAILRARDRLTAEVDSVRAVEKCKQHPGKMWVLEGETMRPLLDQPPAGEVPWHSRQYQDLPEVYVQNSSLEIAWTRVLSADPPSIAGQRVAPLVTDGAEGFSVDYPDDLVMAELMVARGQATLPSVEVAA